MLFRLADSFSRALAKLTPQEQKLVKITVFDLQQDPSAPGFQFHRIDASKDPNFWSIRVNRDIRAVVHKTEASFLVCYVDHHDDAYSWAERRRIEAHPRTGAAQIVEVRERVEEIARPIYVEAEAAAMMEAADGKHEAYLPSLFNRLSRDNLLGIGVPEDWIEDIRWATEERFLEITDHIPAEAGEALLEYVTSGVLKLAEAGPVDISPFDHPDAQRRFRVLDDIEELSRALDYPWEQWAVFLHPHQRGTVDQDFNGPARVSGSAGTGKTVVALHRVARVLREDAQARVLLTTFSAPLANALRAKLAVLADAVGHDDRVTVLPFQGAARELFTLALGHEPRPATQDRVAAALRAAADDLAVAGFPERFLMAEWLQVVDAWQIDDLAGYTNVPRLGRRNRLGAKQRERLWPVFEAARKLLEDTGFMTWPRIFAAVTEHFAARDHKPFSHVIVDEAQDLGVPELRMLGAIAKDGPNGLFFAGDLGQRIFQDPFSWKSLGVDIRGRSRTLKVNYRTSHQIRTAVDRLLPDTIRDVDGNEEDRTNTVSVFNGPPPDVRIVPDQDEERRVIGLWLLEAMEESVEPDEIGVFVRSEQELPRARGVVAEVGQKALELSERFEARDGRIAIGTMHLAKGLEFKAVVVMACDDDVLPSSERMANVADEAELDMVHETERHLFYVACTRARDRLLVTGIEPASEFFEDMGHGVDDC